MRQYILRIEDDPCPHDPRGDDNLGTMICFHRRYDLGDKHTYNHQDYAGWNDMKQAIVKQENVGIILPLYLYDHSGITIDTKPFSCPWDSGQVGFIFITKAKMLEEYGGKKVTRKLIERVTSYLENEVIEYDRYLRGEAYGAIVEEAFTNNDGDTFWEECDACWGFSTREDAEDWGNGTIKYLKKQTT